MAAKTASFPAQKTRRSIAKKAGFQSSLPDSVVASLSELRRSWYARMGRNLQKQPN